MDNVELYVKGHSGKDIGTWAYVLSVPKKHHKSCTGTRENASHNLMEIEACINGLEALTRPCNVALYTNSTYLQGGLALLAEGTNYETNILAWQRLLNAGRGHVINCNHVLKVQNSGYMRLVDSLALNLLPPPDRRGA